MSKRRLLGVRKLQRFLESHDISAQAFAKLAGVGRTQMYRVISGETTKVLVDFALAVSRASKGAIELRDFASSTRYEADPILDVERRIGRAAARSKRERHRPTHPPESGPNATVIS